MKKFLSLTLVAVMLCTTLMLTSCDAVMELLQQYIPGLESDVRTTVTEAEWNAALNMENYTAESKITYDGETSISTYKFTKDGYYLKSDYVENIYVFKGDACYLLQEDANGMVATWAGDVESHSIMKQFVAGAEFSDLKYDESKKAYILEENESMGEQTLYGIMELRFENGVLVNLTITIANGSDKLVMEYVISNVGTTVVNVPKYTMGE